MVFLASRFWTATLPNGWHIHVAKTAALTMEPRIPGANPNARAIAKRTTVKNNGTQVVCGGATIMTAAGAKAVQATPVVVRIGDIDEWHDGTAF